MIYLCMKAIQFVCMHIDPDVPISNLEFALGYKLKSLCYSSFM